MYRVKIHGAGSIGNHLGHAARSLGWHVDICDIDPAVLARTRDEIYPARYGAWDPEIGLFASDEAPRGGYDLICIGTPPDSHLSVAATALREAPRAILVEKPLCPPDLDGAQELAETLAETGIRGFVGYDHVVGDAACQADDLLRAKAFGAVETLDVEFREHWGGIFAAHPWLDGPRDSYLGYWRRGGGALGEHSHALNLWQHFAHGIGAGRVSVVDAMAAYNRDGGIDYDWIGLVNLRTENGLPGRVVQDVVTSPVRKWARVQGGSGFLEWQCGREPGIDAVSWRSGEAETQQRLFEKTRPTDFIKELQHIHAALEAGDGDSPIAIGRGLDTMLVIAAAHMSAQARRAVEIDYDQGYTSAALRLS